VHYSFVQCPIGNVSNSSLVWNMQKVWAIHTPKGVFDKLHTRFWAIGNPKRVFDKLHTRFWAIGNPKRVFDKLHTRF